MTFTLIPNRSLTVITSKNEVISTRSDNPNWHKIMDALKSGDEYAVTQLINMKNTVLSFTANVDTDGTISIVNGEVFYRNTERLAGLDVQRIIEFSQNSLPAAGYVKFLEKKMKNPSKRSIDELYKFLEHGYMPITPDGNFLGYKGLREDYYSRNTGEEPLIKGKRDSRGGIYNAVGEEVLMERRYVCDDFNQGCGPGIHVGTMDYAKSWAGATGKVVIVEVDPAYVVSVPTSETDKLRCCGYKVVGEFKAALPQTYTEEFSSEHKLAESSEYDDASTSNTNSSTYDSGYEKGFKDGKAHNKREYYYNDTLNTSLDSYERGYCEGYDKGRYSNSCKSKAK